MVRARSDPKTRRRKRRSRRVRTRKRSRRVRTRKRSMNKRGGSNETDKPAGAREQAREVAREKVRRLREKQAYRDSGMRHTRDASVVSAHEAKIAQSKQPAVIAANNFRESKNMTLITIFFKFLSNVFDKEGMAQIVGETIEKLRAPAGGGLQGTGSGKVTAVAHEVTSTALHTVAIIGGMAISGSLTATHLPILVGLMGSRVVPGVYDKLLRTVGITKPNQIKYKKMGYTKDQHIRREIIGLYEKVYTGLTDLDDTFSLYNDVIESFQNPPEA
jgi:hypothetical protein